MKNIDQQPNWLPHLTDKVVSDALGHELCAYAVALEGWRRGLTLRWYTKDAQPFQNMKTWYVDTPGKLFSLSSKDKTHYFFRTRGDKVYNDAVEIGADKERTKSMLAQAGIPVPEGKRFRADVQQEEVLSYASTIGFPVVLKPTDGSFGRDVMTDIQDEKSLKKALRKVRPQLHDADLLVERFIPGEEYRLYVVGNQVAGAIHRIPAHVIGDGKSTIQTLINMKNKERQQNPRLISCPIQIDEQVISFIQEAGYTLDSVPEKGDHVFLRKNSNVSLGGDPIDVTDKLYPKIKDTAIQAIKAIPGLYHGGVDLIVDESQSAHHTAVVLELNPTAQIGALLYPLQGHARDIPKAIIDYYFPETTSSGYTMFYFDFNRVLEPLQNKSALVTTVPPAPLGEVYAKKYTVFGDVQDIHYHRQLRDQALDRQLHGYIYNLDHDRIEVVVAGTDRDLVDQFQDYITQYTDKERVTHIHADDWKQPVKIGFDIQANPHKIAANLNKMRQEIKIIEKEKILAERQHMKYLQSRLWKLTLPLRKVLNYMRHR